MAEHVCPWWAGYLIDNALRRLLHDPQRIIGPYVHAGMTTLDVGCGMGFFSIAMAQRVGPTGRVISVDLQPQMLAVLEQRAARAGVADCIHTRRCEPVHLGLAPFANTCDFALAFAMVHEVPAPERLLAEIHACLKPPAVSASGGLLLVAEPRLHVPARAFSRLRALAASAGFAERAAPPVRWSRAALFARVATGA